MKNQIIIGFGYRAKSGKDTAGAYLVSNYGFTRIANADALKEVISIITGEDAHDPEFKESPTCLGVSGGAALQIIGVALRDKFPEIWIKASGLEQAAKYVERIVITDVRFQNEADAVKNLGGILVRINRPGYSGDTHTSETSGDHINWDYVINNTGTLNDFEAKLDALIRRLLPEP